MKNPLISFARAIYGNPASGTSASSSSSGPHAPNNPATSSASTSSHVAPATPFKGASSTVASAGSSNAKFSSGSPSSSSHRLSDSGGSIARSTSTGSPRGSHSYLNHHHTHPHTSAYASQYPGAYIDDDLLHSTSLGGGPGAMTHLTTCPCFHAYSTAGGHPQFWGSAIKCNCATRLDFSQVLPTELALHVMGFLDPASLAAVARCSKSMHALATDQGVWREMYRNNAKWRTSILARPGRLPYLPALVGAAACGTSALVHQNGMTSLPSMTLPSPPASPVKHQSSTGRSPSPSGPAFETDSDGDAIMHDVTPTASQPSSPTRNGGTRASSPAPQAIDWQFLYRNRAQLDTNWELQESMQIRTLKGHTDSVYCIQFDRDWLISGSRDQTVCIWSMATGQVLKTLTGHTGSVLCLQYDSKMLVTGSSDATVIVWDLPSGTRRGTLAGHSAGVLDVAFDGEFIVSCSKDATIKVWERRSAAPATTTTTRATGTQDAGYVLKHTLTGHRAAVNAIQLRGDVLVSASGDYVLKMWNVRTGALIRNLEGHTRGIACVAYDGQIVVSGSNDQTIRIWDASTGQCVHILQGHTDLVRTLALDTVRGYVVSGSYDQTVKVWKVPNHVMDIVERGRAKDAERAARARADKRKRDEEAQAAARTSGLSRPGSPSLSVKSSSSSSSGASTPVHHGETASPGQPSLTHASSAGSVNSTGSGSTTGAVPAAASAPAAPVPQLPLSRIPKSTAINTFDKTHTSWVFNVGISPTHIVSASQDQTIVVYEYTQGVDKRWII